MSFLQFNCGNQFVSAASIQGQYYHWRIMKQWLLSGMFTFKTPFIISATMLIFIAWNQNIYQNIFPSFLSNFIRRSRSSGQHWKKTRYIVVVQHIHCENYKWHAAEQLLEEECKINLYLPLDGAWYKIKYFVEKLCTF